MYKVKMKQEILAKFKDIKDGMSIEIWFFSSMKQNIYRTYMSYISIFI